MDAKAEDEDEDGHQALLAWLESRPTFLEERNHPNHWFNRAADLRASAGALWVAMESDQATTQRLNLGSGYSLSVACLPVYHMLCGLALELIMKARLVQLGYSDKQFGHHKLEKLIDQLQVEASENERRLLRFYEAAMVWAGRYPLPRNATKQQVLDYWELASDVLTEPLPEIQGIELRRGNDADSWENFHALWRKYAALFEHR